MGTIHDDGWIKLYRKSIKSRVFQNEGLWKLWTWCLLRANHEDVWVPIKTGRGVTEVLVKRGQFIFGRKAASKELKMRPSTVEHRMQKLAKMQNLVIQPVTHYSIVTICNYDFYQGSENKELSGNSSTNGQPSVTNKNDKNNNIHYVEGSDVLRLADLLLTEILKNKPNFRQPDLQSWAKEIDLMIRKDGRRPDRIREVIFWCQSDPFWWPNILSPRRLREKFDELEAKMMAAFKPRDCLWSRDPEYENLTGGGTQ